ncbi:MAG TPA: hypothetical protein VFC83_03710 [Erysipelotrichaceae bacterium]|nr:hypothetical protein [Erysipelotrichaceae bacterium]
MRKIFKTLLALALSLAILVGCSTNPQTQVSEADQVLINIKDNEIKKANIYQYLKLRFGPNLITSNLIQMQLDKFVTLDAADEAEGEKRLNDTKELLGDDFEKVILSSGYSSVDDYYDRVILSQIKNEKMFNTYLDENYLQITNDLHTAQIKKIRTNSKADAEAALADLNSLDSVSVEDFVTVAEMYSQEEKIAASSIEHVYDQRTVLTFLNEKLKDAKPGLIPEVIMDGEVFYIIFVEDFDLEVNKEKVIEEMFMDETINNVLSEQMFLDYSEAGNFEIHDSDLYDLFNELN